MPDDVAAAAHRRAGAGAGTATTWSRSGPGSRTTSARPEEKILEEKAVTGRSAFVRLFEETVSSLTCPFEHDGEAETLSLQQILAKLYDADRDGPQGGGGRPDARACKENARLLTYIFNTVVLDHKSDCDAPPASPTRWPRATWPTRSTPAVVEALMTAAERHHATVHRYYRLKGRLLGLDQLDDYDRYAPLFADLPGCDWPTARRIVEESYERVQPAGRGDRPRVLRQALDRRRAAAGQARRGLQQQRGPERPPVHPDELHRQAPRRDDAGPRAGPRPAPVPVARRRLPPVRHAADDRRDGQRLRRDAHLPAGC